MVQTFAPSGSQVLCLLEARFTLSLMIENAEKLMKTASEQIDIDKVRRIENEADEWMRKHN